MDRGKPRTDTGRARQPRLGAMNIWILLASSCYWAWFDSATFHPTLFLFQPGSENLYGLYFVLTLSSGAVMLLLCVKAKDRFVRFLSLRRSEFLLVGAATLSNLLTMLGAFLANMPLVVLGAIMTGASCSLLLLMWARLYSRQGARSASLLISAAIAIGVLIDVLVFGLNALFAAVFTALLPVFMIGIWGFAKTMDETTRNASSLYARLLPENLTGSEPPEVAATTSDGPVRTLTLDSIFSGTGHRLFGLSFSLLAAFFIFGFSFGFLQFSSVLASEGSYPTSSEVILLARGGTALLIFLAIYFFPKKMYTVFRIGVLVGIAGFISVPFFGTLDASVFVSHLAIVVGYTTFDIITWTLLSELAYSTRSDAVLTFAPGRFVVHGAIVIGFLAALAVASSSGGTALQSAFSTTVGYFLVIAEMLLLSENSALWMLIRTDMSPCGNEPPLELDTDSVAYTSRSLLQIIETYGLTSREAEILRYVLMGRSRPRIAQILCISLNTVDSHIQHIYRKLGVHGHQDLLDRFS